MIKKISMAFLGLFTISNVTNAKVTKKISDESDKEIEKPEYESFSSNSAASEILEVKLETLSRDDLIRVIKDSALRSINTNLILNHNHGIDVSDIRSRLGSHEHRGH